MTIRRAIPWQFTRPLLVAAGVAMASWAAHADGKETPATSSAPTAEPSKNAPSNPPMSGMDIVPAAPMMGASMAVPGLFMEALNTTSLGPLFRASRLTVSGWLDMSFTASTAQHDNTPMLFNYRANELLLQQAWLRIDRSIDRTGTEFSWGFRSDWLFGSDYRYTLARGIFNSQLTADGKPAT